MKIKICFALLALLGLWSCQKSRTFSDEDLALIPQPAHYQLGNSSFTFDENTSWVAPDSLQRQAAEVLQQKFQHSAGFSYKNQASVQSENNVVRFEKDTSLPKEAYVLEVSDKRIRIRASALNGYLYAVETLRQLLPVEIESTTRQKVKWQIPTIEITDQPRYAWRGVMLDVVRHFFPKEYILKTLDRMAFLKMNVLHLHLVDDQGWRLEIKKYPKLTQVGAWRVDQEQLHWDGRKPNDPAQKGTYGGFYTQEDIREIVAYAHRLGIAVMPEIEMPAHVTSAIAAYPELSCKKTPVAVPSGGVWPITDIYCAGDDKVFTFLEDVLEETMALFPDAYIHIGGDEATKTEWEKCPRCRQRMKDHHLTTTEQLQGYFVSRIEAFIASKNRKMMGWDEILEGGLPERAAVMSWRGVEGGIKAAEKGHFVVMTPNQCYLDQYQGLPHMEPLAIGGYVPLKKVYEFDPITPQMTDKQKSFILGAQANLWSEYIPNIKQSEYMLFPRLLALSEVLWTPENQRDWNTFTQRLQRQLPRWDVWGVNYSKSMYQVVGKAQMLENQLQLELNTEYPQAEIRYTINTPDFSTSKKYEKPLFVDTSAVIRSAVFRAGKMIGAITTDTLTFHKAVNKTVSFLIPYHKSYQGQGDGTLTNVVRGTTNFHDKQWLAWLGEDAQWIVDLGEHTLIHGVSVGSMQNQGQGIYFPSEIRVMLSEDGKVFSHEKVIKIPYLRDGYPKVKDFDFTWNGVSARYIKVICKNAKAPNGGDAWIFFDEIQVK